MADPITDLSAIPYPLTASTYLFWTVPLITGGFPITQYNIYTNYGGTFKNYVIPGDGSSFTIT